MTIRCSLLGHRFEEATVEREREEQGDEVLTVSREVETCSRCGAERVVSENTEITTVEPGPDETADDAGGFGAVVDRSDAGDGAATVGGDGEPLDPPDDPAEEDAEILTDEDDGERGPGEWPEEPTATVEESPDTSGMTTGESAPDPEDREPASEAETFTCPECGFTTATEGSSLRRGDVCPQCMDGYLETR